MGLSQVHANADTWWTATAMHREMAYVGGALYLSGGVLVLLSVIMTSRELAATEVVVGVGVAAALVGVFFLVAAKRLVMPVWQYAIATTMGSVLITVAVFAGGPQTAATFGVLYVLVAAYGFYYYPWAVAGWLTALSGGGFAAALLVHHVEDAGVQWLMIIGAQVLAGGLIGTLGRNVRDLLRREQSRVAELNELDHWKTTFMRAVAHDLRSPLAAMLGSVTLIRDQAGKLTADQQHDLASGSVSAGERLQVLIEDLLDLDRIEAKEIQPHREPTSLDDLVHVSLAAMDLGGRSVTVDAAPVVADVEPAKIDRIITNLVSNALRHTPADAEVWVRVRAEDGDAMIAVEDSGPGLPPEIRDGLFTAFGNRDATERAAGSVGLGLHLVRRFTEFHGGTVHAADRSGGGASFVVRIPLTAAQTSSSGRGD